MTSEELQLRVRRYNLSKMREHSWSIINQEKWRKDWEKLIRDEAEHIKKQQTKK